jgi:hypothetical protein
MSELFTMVGVMAFAAGLGVGGAVMRYLVRSEADIHRIALEMIRDGNPMLPDRLQSAWMQEVAGKALERRTS